MPNAIDLFAGCGGMSLGLERAGFNVLYANEINGDAMKTYKHNFPHVHAELGDASKISPLNVAKKIGVKNIDLIAAGTPCQGFSTSGKRNPNDPRNDLFKQLIKFVKVFKPKVFVMENVVGILHIQNGIMFENILKSFRKLGYNVKHDVLTASEFGVPQYRKRVFVICTKLDIAVEKLFPKRKHKQVSVEEALSDISHLGVNDKINTYQSSPNSEYQKKMRRNSKKVYNHESPNHSPAIRKRFSNIRPGRSNQDLPDKLNTQKRDTYRLEPKLPSRTVTTLPEDLIHYKQDRIPTVREMARLQSFPDSFVFYGPRTTGGKQRVRSCPQYTQVGNAVPPLLAEKIFRHLRKVVFEQSNK